jgi:hypothetical protein
VAVAQADYLKGWRSATTSMPLACGRALWPISEAECTVASWQQRGYADGYGGHPPQYLRLARHDGRFEWERLMGSMRRRGAL